MIKKKLLSASLTAAVLAVMPAVNAFAAEEPVFQHFNKNDVNGSVTVALPAGMSANVSITFDSPEGKAEPYYVKELAENTTATFDIEGRDNTEDDYRNYLLTVTPTGAGVKPFTAEFTVPDGNDNPDSFKELKYTFTVDDVISDNDWDATDAEGVVTVAYHLNAFTLGDVNVDGKVDAKDASKVLVYYSKMSTGAEGDLSEAQKKAANVNGDKLIDAKDASRILVYYSIASTGGTPTWD